MIFYTIKSCEILTAHSEASSTVSIRAAPLGGALRAGVACAVGGARAGGRALLVGELHDGEQGEGLCKVNMVQHYIILLSSYWFHFSNFLSQLLTSSPGVRDVVGVADVRGGKHPEDRQ